MKILVFSDSHGALENIDQAISLHGGRADLVIFLGDGLRDIDAIREKYTNIAFYSVKGNCDFFGGDTPKESVLDLDGIRVLITHGDKYSVKYGLTSILYAGREKEVDAIFFGHTHIPYEASEYIDEKRLQLFNPGSIGMSRTYGVVNTSNGILVTSIARLP